MRLGVYEEALQYLTGDGEEERGINTSTLEKYRVGLGTEKFSNEDGHVSGFDSVYFPIYMPRDTKKKTKNDVSDKDEASMLETEEYMNTEMAQFVKVKARAVYKDNKSKQRFLPAGSKLR